MDKIDRTGAIGHLFNFHNYLLAPEKKNPVLIDRAIFDDPECGELGITFRGTVTANKLKR